MFDPLFTSARLRLAAPLPADQADFARWSQDADYLRLLDDDPIRPLAEAAFGSFANPNDSDSYFHLRTLEADTLIGFVVLHGIKWPGGSALLAMGIGEPTYRGKGYGSEALRLILRYGFMELGLHRVGLTVLAYNTAAIRAYERVGFVREGCTRQAVLRQGMRHDLLAYGILREEYLKTIE
jgi:RimJ/RimL family protein N-acetyltransferase